MDTSKIFGYIIFLIHYVLFYILPVYLSIFSKKRLILLAVIFYWMMVIFNWYLFDSCFITILEHRLIYGKYSNNKWSSWYVETIKKYFGNILGNILKIIIILSPLLFSLCAMYNIHNLCKK